MKILGLDGKYYNLNLKVSEIDDDNRSSFHLAARLLIKEAFPLDCVLEEVVIPGACGLRADFIIPLRRVIFEVHGKQHYEFVPYFHKSRAEFNDSQKRDFDKIRWCHINKFSLVELDTRDQSDWLKRIRDYHEYSK